MKYLTLTDRCNVSLDRQAPAYQLVGTALAIVGDTIFLDGVPVLHRVEPIGMSDNHWERVGDEPVAMRRYTHIEVDRDGRGDGRMHP